MSDVLNTDVILSREDGEGSPHRAPAGTTYWESRAREYARDGAGLRAVCSYGMPWFYNWMIHCSQSLALRRWLRVTPGMKVLDVGCGIGRWSRMLARRGALVTGVDLAPTMVAEAEERAGREGVSDRCRFMVSDLAALRLDDTYQLIVGVTVLQHILDEGAFATAIGNLARHLAPGGRMVLLEAAPTTMIGRCDTAIFRARTADAYLARFTAAGLHCAAMTGVDPSPLKTMFLPYYRRLPRPLAAAIMGLITLVSAPIDFIAGRLLTRMSWHKVFVLEHAAE